jgi:hypothetical protein
MSRKSIIRCMALLLIMLAFGMTYTPAEAGISVGGAINPIPTPTNIFTAPGQETDVVVRLQNTSQTTPPDLFQFLPATLTGVTFTIMACADSACTVPLPGTLEFVPVGGNGCVANDPGVASCSLDLVTDATGNTVAITISGGGVALPAANVGPLDLATVRVRSTAPVSTPGGQFFLRAMTGPDDVSATFNGQTATGGMEGSTILVFQAAPCIDVTKECVNPNACDLNIPFSGVVTNCGNEDLANVTVTDSPSGQVFTIGTLAPGESAPYSGSYTGSVGSNTDTVTAEGTGLISGQTVNATASATCDVTCNACIEVSKECVNPDVCDTTIPFSGVVTNCGTDVLNSVTITDSPSGQVFTIGTLAPGASAPYSGLYTGTLGSNTDTVTATGTGAVTGQPVSATASATCDVTCNACIEVTKECVNPDACDTTIPFSGVVTNCGPDVLNNVTVTDAPSGQVFTIGTLAPGASAPFSGTYTGTLGPNTDTVTATGTGTVTGQTVTETASATCDVTCEACIAVTKECVNPDACDTTIPFSGVVTNCGSDELSNVTVTDAPSGQVFTIGTLAAGASAPYSGSYTGTLGPNTDTVTATGTGTVTGQTVTETASATCDVTCEACIDVTKECINPDECDTSIPFSGVVTNCGSDALNNVTVTDAPSGQVFTIGTLAAGASAPYSGSYIGTLGSNTDTVTATGTGEVTGQTVEATASATCDVTCQPCIDVTKECQDGVCGPITFSGVVTNCGPDVLENVTVTDSETGPVLGPITLNPGESAPYNDSYTPAVPGLSTDTVTATGTGVVSQQTVTAEASATCEYSCVFGTCRTPGFWGTHAGVEKPTSNNITLQVITECDGCLSICGESVTNTLLNDANSAVEAMCVSPRGDIRNQLARQLTAASLNCCVSGAGSDCSGLPMWDVVFGECNILCAAEISEAYQICIDALDCLNNGGNILFINDEVACQTGTCEPMDTQEPITQACGENLPNCPEGYMCVDLEDSCHTRVLGVCDDGSICTVENTTDGFCDSDGSKCKPGPAGSSKECSDAIGSKKDPNNCTIIPKPSPAECSDKNQGEECCGADAATCDLIDGI